MLNTLLSIFSDKMLLQLLRMLLFRVIQEIDSKLAESEKTKNREMAEAYLREINPQWDEQTIQNYININKNKE